MQDEEEYSGDEENGGLSEDDNAREGIDVEPSEPTHPPPAAQHPSTEGAESVMRKLVMDAVAQNKVKLLTKDDLLNMCVPLELAAFSVGSAVHHTTHDWFEKS